MKNLVLIFAISILIATGCSSQQKTEISIKGLNNSSLLDFYRQYSEFTDPGEYAYLYENLPDSLPELCKLIRSQFLHLYAELPQYSDKIPKERWNESLKYPTVKLMLEALVFNDSRGLVYDRKPEDRLVLGCRDYSVLLASILKYRSVPARLRAGHATYLIPDFHASHTICEVWNDDDKRWMLVDPNTGMTDFSRDKFDFSNDTWLQMQKKEINSDQYGNPGKYSGQISILGKVSPDLAMVLGKEYTTYHYAPIMGYAFKNNDQVCNEHKEILEEICELMKSLDAENLLKLQEIYNSTPEIQVSKQFEVRKIEAKKNSDIKASSMSKPNIEFIDIPTGTFLMGSPDTEKERNDDEIQHQVTLSAFKMSKYAITVEQYNIFCKATGRRKPWYGPYGKSTNPVSQITWYDASEFAKWMGCRLPTEAEMEYAIRANSTTPFYTGNCITTNQSNFKGKEPYSNCTKGRNRNKPIPVGSFEPNDFGLFDMHGNMLEWTNDWYGQYDTTDTINPTGSDNGTHKVARGGGWFQPAGECRSACRGGGIPPGNRGAGISFRLVKDE